MIFEKGGGAKISIVLIIYTPDSVVQGWGAGNSVPVPALRGQNYASPFTGQE